MTVRYVVVCRCEGALKTREGIRTGKLTVGWIDDTRAEDGTVSLLAYHISKNWRDRSENTIRCEKCRKSAQFSPATSAAVCDRLAVMAQTLDMFPVVERVPAMAVIPEKFYEVPLGVLCERLRG